MKTKNETLGFMAKNYHDTLFEYALRLTKNLDDAHDLVQDTMVKATRFYNNFQEGTNLYGWLFIIMKNTFINSYRRRSMTRTLIVQTDDLNSSELRMGCSTNAATAKFISMDIHRAIGLLPQEYAQAFKRSFEGYKYSEIAIEFNIPVGTVKTRIYNARTLLKKHLSQYSR
ncbi:sigma-70 family RNA polymerase sigma factor [Pedobacter jamesrossensis]|uniref:Sigma-70 family RNA polymerase sigma factor n=1 Tax=Pedobacter jamesrossensis TaxID=1908238 RepID=A0ABV8NL15_9SPHI